MVKLNPVPERIRAPLDGEILSKLKVQEKIDNFFVETKEYLEKKYKDEFPVIEVQIYPLIHNYSEGSDMIITNDRINYLLYNDKLVAGVIERRTEFNNLEYIFFRNLRTINPKLPFKLRKIK
jgi:hypothetical protein